MRPLAEQDHYEILEVPREAASDEIERSYRIVRGTYAEGSAAGYSVIGPGDARLLRERIEAAYQVLSDDRQRAAYDSWLAQQRDHRKEEAAPEPLMPAPGVVPEEPDETLEGLDLPDEYDGPALRRLRLLRGVELEEIAAVTKINPLYLRYIEEERFADLPAAVYVRGFVSAFAHCLGLDADRAATSYTRRFRERRAAGRRAGR